MICCDGEGRLNEKSVLLQSRYFYVLSYIFHVTRRWHMNSENVFNSNISFGYLDSWTRDNILQLQQILYIPPIWMHVVEKQKQNIRFCESWTTDFNLLRVRIMSSSLKQLIDFNMLRVRIMSSSIKQLVKISISNFIVKCSWDAKGEYWVMWKVDNSLQYG